MAAINKSASAQSSGDVRDGQKPSTTKLDEQDFVETAVLYPETGRRNTPENAHTLTQNELQFIANAKASGHLAELMALAKLCDTGTTLEELKASTTDHHAFVDSVAKQASALQSHVERCKSLMDANTNSQNQRSDARRLKLEKAKAAKARLEDMAVSDEYELQRAVPRSIAQTENIASGHTHLSGQQFDTRNWGTDMAALIPDDQFFGNLLDKLQALGLEIKVTDASRSIVNTARYYSSLEVMLSIVACKRTLDSVLKEALQKYPFVHPAGTGHSRTLEAEIAAVKEEIQSLWDEVVPVAHMAIEKTMLEPILKLVNVKLESHQYQNAIIGNYIGSCLSFMNERLELLASHINIAVYHHLALSITYEYQRSSNAKQSAITQSIFTKGYVTDPANNQRGPKQVTNLLEYIRQGLEAYGGFPSKALHTSTPAEEKAALLNEFVAKRASKNNERLRNLHTFFESAVKDDLQGGTNLNAEVLECLLADSLRGYGYRGAVLRDAQTEESLEALDDEIKSIRELQKTLEIPEVPVTEILKPTYQRMVGKLALNKTGLAMPGICLQGTVAPDRDSSDVFRFASRGLEIIQRWSDLIDASKK